MNLLQKLFPLNVFLFSSFLLAGQTYKSNMPEKYKNLPKGTVIYNFMNGDTVTNTQVELPDSLKRYIVEFTEKPLYAIVQQNHLKSASLVNSQLQKIDRQHIQFASDLSQLKGVQTPGLKSQSISGVSNSTNKEFRKVFNGVSVSADKNLISQIEQLGYVKKVYPDNMVEAVDDGSNRAIKADSVWKKYGATGKGVVIAIIDTGIDSTHQDLSHGKVIGGYDFVNNDNDPMDDHGHGTHCAGIAAANGPGLKGVAPDAKLLAVKVLNEWGSGYDSWIIAGIEYAIDPDGNPLTDDGADIISMSLGAPEGNPDDPMSTAVNNAYRKGVLCVIAAGNSGSNYHTIGTPGCAKEALTVGASDKNYNIASFSSRGPSLNSYEIKPNILAPGYDIHSSLPNNGYANWNGTSMATPHIAGSAALLKEIHPEWNAQVMRSALVHSAVSVNNYDVWTEGNGMVDLMKAAGVTSSLSKNSINFGLIPDSVTSYVKIDTFYVQNISKLNLNYHLSNNDPLPSEIKLTLSPDNFSLAPSDSQRIIFSFKASNTTLAYPTTSVAAYTGTVIINDGIQPQNLNFSVIKSHSLNIKFDFIPMLVVIHDNISKSYTLSTSNNNYLSRLLPTGIYDIIAVKDNHFIIRENIDITKTQNVEISFKEAKNKVEFQGVDQDGDKLKLFDQSPELLITKKNSYYNLGYSVTKIVAWDGYTFPPVVKYFSDFSDKYRYELAPLVYPHTNADHNWYSFPFLIDYPLHNDTILCNKPQELIKVNYNYCNNDKQIDSIYFCLGYGTTSIGFSYNIYDQIEESRNILTQPFTYSQFTIPSPDKSYRVYNWLRNRLYKFHNKINPTKDSLLYISPTYQFFKDSDNVKLNLNFNNFDLTTKDLTFKQNISPGYNITNNWFNQTTKELVFNKGYYQFRKMDGGISPGKLFYTYSKGAEIIKQDSIVASESEDQIALPYLQNIGYSLKLQSDRYLLYKKSGKSTAFFYFNIGETLTGGDYPNHLQDFQIKSNNQITDILNRDFSNELIFSLNSLPYKIVKLYLKAEKDSVWHPILNYLNNSNPVKSQFSVQFSDTLRNNYYSLKLSVISSDNDSSVHFFEPAFYVMNNQESDSITLVDFYSSTKGNTWTNNSNWLKTRMKDWYGVVMENGRVVGINLPDNNLQGALPENFNNLSKLKSLTLNDNYLEIINDLTGLKNLTSLNVVNNNLTFEDLIPNLSIESINYIPQRKLGKEQKIVLIENARYELNTFFTEKGCHFFWFKDSKQINGIDASRLTIDNVSKSDEGNYSCFIKSENVPGLFLEFSPFIISVKPPIFICRDDLIANQDINSFGGSWIDFDNDGDQDLFIVNYNKPNQLLQNMLMETNTVSFKDVSEKVFGPGEGSSISAAWGDINNDGYIDVFIVTQKYDEPNKLYVNNGNGTFSNLDDPVIFRETRHSESANWSDVNRDGWLDLFIAENWNYNIQNKNGSNLFINQHNLTFQRKSDPTIDGCPQLNFSTWSDFDNDGDPDAFFSGYCIDRFLKNNGENFSWIEPTYYSTSSSTTSSSGDFDNDGDFDIFEGREKINQNQEIKNLLLINDRGLFTQSTDTTITSDLINYKSSSWGDFDNDGDLDLLGTSYNGQINLWSNQLQETGKVSFIKIDYGPLNDGLMGARGCSFADYDNDGDLDIFIAGSTYGNHLIENVAGSKNNWINIKCTGTKSNNTAIGTKVKIKATINHKPCWQTQEISSMTGCSGQNSLNVEFGLGNATIIDSIRVYWPSGIYWDTTGVAVNQFMKLVEKEKPNDIPQIVSFNDTLIYENASFSHSYRIIDKWNKGISVTVTKKPSWLKSILQGQTITFTGTPGDYSPGNYKLIISIDDGYIKSPVIDSINMIVENVDDAPVILGQIPVSLNSSGQVILSIDQLMVVDIDNELKDLSIITLAGEHYTLSHDTIWANVDYFGDLSVPVQVNDGSLLSNVFVIKIKGRSNDIPYIKNEYKELHATEDIYFEAELTITDYNFTKLEVSQKSNIPWISFSNSINKITLSGTPENSDTGINRLIFEMNDGYLDKPVIDTIVIDVQPVNDAPIITGQSHISFRDKGPIKILLNDLMVEDVDNNYPVNFHLIINEGSGYSISADTIFPAKNEILFVPVQVNDGQLSSNIYNLKIDFITDVSDKLISDLKIYPNPFDNFIRINSLSKVTIQKVEVFDLLGKNVTSILSGSKNEYIIDCSQLDQTLYLLKITTNDNSFIQKLIKKR